MQRYTQREGTPLAFHRFFRYVLLPVEAIMAAINLLDMVQVDYGINAVTIVNYTYCFLNMALCVLCFIGFFKWKPYAWFGTMALLLLDPVYNVWQVGTLAVYLPGGVTLGLLELALTVLYSALVGYYYIKRRALFNGSRTLAGVESGTAAPPESAVPPRAQVRRSEPVLTEDRSNKRYCVKCGGEVSGVGDKCPHCGAPRLKRQS